MTVLCQALVFKLGFIRGTLFNEVASVHLCLIKYDSNRFRCANKSRNCFLNDFVYFLHGYLQRHDQEKEVHRSFCDDLESIFEH